MRKVSTERLSRLVKSIPDFLRSRRREAEFLALGVFLAGAGVLVSLILSGGDRRGIEVVTSGEESDGRVESGMTENLVVDVAGAVIKPGVYRLAADSRFADALAAAGGLTAEADRDWVSRTINLAQNITDGVKIYIQSVGESSTGSTGNLNAESQVSINSASLSELDGLWGVGEARAKAIIEGRPYGSIEELVTRKIVPQNVVERNRERLRL